MKIRYLLVVIVVAMASLAVFAADDHHTPAQPPNPAFDKIKALAGVWEMNTPDGKTVVGTFKVVSAGSAVMAVEPMPEGDEMITIFHPDGDKLIATHYCAAKNQPRFEAVPSDNPNTLVFKLKDVTNLLEPDAGHMTGVVFTFTDPDHHIEEWTFSQGGKETTEKLELTRVK